MTTVKIEDIGKLLALIVHDLRNPSATVGANVAFVRDAGLEGQSEDVVEAFDDVGVALGELTDGLEHVAWIARWLAGQPSASVTDGNVVASLRAIEYPKLHIERRLPDEDLPARGGGATLRRLVRVLLANCAQHARGKPVQLEARRDGDEVVVEVRDEGAAIAAELREAAFTLGGQQELKGRADGRYGRVAGLFAVRLLAEAMGASVEADSDGAQAVFRVRLARASSV